MHKNKQSTKNIVLLINVILPRKFLQFDGSNLCNFRYFYTKSAPMPGSDTSDSSSYGGFCAGAFYACVWQFCDVYVFFRKAYCYLISFVRNLPGHLYASNPLPKLWIDTLRGCYCNFCWFICIFLQTHRLYLHFPLLRKPLLIGVEWIRFFEA